MDRIVFVHKAVENMCTSILGRHVICDAIIRVTMFYLDHTPTESVCKRFFFCSNHGFFDWWHTKVDFPEGSQNSTIWKILNSRDKVLDSNKAWETSVKSLLEQYMKLSSLY
ncbi:unnamed protein product [Caenorhabditis sp. 36 PRJEB53466]|nr:unnamed protein product [Caenorhabditis sp. 36 PRJEB53466]